MMIFFYIWITYIILGPALLALIFWIDKNTYLNSTVTITFWPLPFEYRKEPGSLNYFLIKK